MFDKFFLYLKMRIRIGMDRIDKICLTYLNLSLLNEVLMERLWLGRVNRSR